MLKRHSGMPFYNAGGQSPCYLVLLYLENLCSGRCLSIILDWAEVTPFEQRFPVLVGVTESLSLTPSFWLFSPLSHLPADVIWSAGPPRLGAVSRAEEKAKDSHVNSDLGQRFSLHRKKHHSHALLSHSSTNNRVTPFQGNWAL